MKRLAQDIEKMLNNKVFITANGPVYRFTNEEDFVEPKNAKLQIGIEEMEVDSFPDTHQNFVDAACNFLRKPGQIYHLYLHCTGKKYFSMISPEEWGEAPHKYLGSWRYESNSTWTNTIRS